jgi:hypothetical protein
MKIYKLYHECDDHDCLYHVDDDGNDFLNRYFKFSIYQDDPEILQWKALPVDFEREEKRTELPNLSGRLVCSDKAWQILSPLLVNDNIELLPLQCKYGNYRIVKPERIDCLDYSRAVVERFDENDKNSGVMKVISYAFKEEIIKNRNFFSTPEDIATNFVSQAFKDCIEANGLEGLYFEQITS